VNTAEVAIPDALVVAVFTPPAKVPAAPLAGAVNVTVTPLTGLPAEFRTVAAKGPAKAVLTLALCGVPPLAIIDAGLAVLLTVKLYVVALDGATNVRGFAVDPSLQLTNTYPLVGEMVTAQLEPAVQGSGVEVM
jgi:hypothetical protein